jgi:predicted ATPase
MEYDFPFCIPSIRNGLNLILEKRVAFFARENGLGKSIVLQAIAHHTISICKLVQRKCLG